MASIRARLTAWNAGVLLIILCVLLAAAYLFVRYASLAQVHRSLLAQKAVVASTVEAHATDHADRSTLVAAVITDLRTHGLMVLQPPGDSTTLVTTPVMVDADDRPRALPDDAGLRSAVNWREFATRFAIQHDDDDPFNIRSAHGVMRVLAWRTTVDAQPFILAVGQPFHDTHELLETARDGALLAIPLAILIAVLSGYLLARRALRPVAAMTADAKRIGARNAHERLSIEDPDDELGQLALAFNDLLGRLDSALEHQRRFTADASHELRTPIALIRAEAEVALASERAGDGEYRSALEATRDSSRQLSRIVEDLFLLARADAGQTLVVPEWMRLDDMIRATALSMRPLAQANDVTLETRSLPAIAYRADETLLRRALTNLIDNAIKYARRPGRVEVALATTPEAHVITVSDDGPGIALGDQPHLFERFFRGDAARPHQETAVSAGAGLGLAIARDIAEFHDGTLTLVSSDERGSTFVIRLPLPLPVTPADAPGRPTP